MIPVPVGLKLLVPGYRARWHHRYAGMIAHLRDIVPTLVFGQDDGQPWIEREDGGPRLYGFWTEPANEEVLRLLGEAVPRAMPPEHFRLVKDYINRFVYPHMRPDLKPSNYSVDQLFGFHGQHKDAIADLEDGVQDHLSEAFQPGAADVIVDGGCFLGFGEARIAPDLPDGHIYAIEASADCFELMKRNVEVNRCANVTPLHRAVWNEKTELQLETGYAQANTLVAEVHKGERTQPTRTITIDGLVAEYGLDRLDMISLTLNGAEIEALAGAKQALDTLRPRLRLAGWYERDGVKIWRLTKEILERHGYDVFVGGRGNVLALPR